MNALIRWHRSSTPSPQANVPGWLFRHLVWASNIVPRVKRNWIIILRKLIHSLNLTWTTWPSERKHQYEWNEESVRTGEALYQCGTRDEDDEKTQQFHEMSRSCLINQSQILFAINAHVETKCGLVLPSEVPLECRAAWPCWKNSPTGICNVTHDICSRSIHWRIWGQRA